jgi:hypothetical protein
MTTASLCVVARFAGQPGVAGGGDGVGTGATFNSPRDAVLSPGGTTLTVVEGSGVVRAVNLATRAVTTVAGSSGLAGYVDSAAPLAARFNAPDAIAADWGGNLFIADQSNNRVRRISPSGAVTTLAGSGSAGFADGLGGAASFNYPQGVRVDSFGSVYVADVVNHRIRKVRPSGLVSTLTGSGAAGGANGVGTLAQLNAPNDFVLDASETVGYIV